MIRIAVVVFGFGNLMLLVRIFSKHEVGIWILFMSIASILETARNGFIRNPMLASLSGSDPSHERKILSSSFSLHLILGFLISLLVWGFGKSLSVFWNVDELQDLFRVYALTNLIMVIVLHFEYIMQARMDFRGILIITVIRLGLFFFFLLFLKVSDLQPGLEVLAWGLFVTSGVTIVIAGFILKWDIISVLIEKSDRSIIRSLFHLGKYTIGTNISSMVIKNTDSWILGKLLSAGAVAIYNPAIRISNLVEVPTLAIANLIFPQVNKFRIQHGHEGIRELYTKSVSLILAIVVPAVTFIFFLAKPITSLILGPEYLEAAGVLQISVFYMLIIPFNRQFGTIMDGLRSPKTNFYLLVMVAALNLVLTLIFVRWFGIYGAAYGTLIAYCTVFVINQWILFRQFRVNTVHVLARIPGWYVSGLKIARRELLVNKD